MKKLLSLLVTVGMTVTASLLIGSGCHKEPIDMCPNKSGIQLSASECTDPPPPPTPAPTGTVTSDKTSIGYKETVTFTYSFQNADQGVYIGGVLVNGQSGTYTTGVLVKDSTFTIVAKGKGGTTTNPSITIVVAPDPRIAFLTTGTFKDAGMTHRKLTDQAWISSPSAFQGLVNDFVFFYQSQNSAPGNLGQYWNSTLGEFRSFYWYFTNETGIYFAGFNYDDFVITGVNSFKIHKFDNVAGYPGEYWLFFQR